MRFPVDEPYKLTQGFSAGHKGIDLAPTPAGSRGRFALAPEAGVVQYARTGTIEGNYVIMRGNSNVYYYFGHFARFLVSPGQPVNEGQPLGEMGMTGQATGVHTHHEVRPGQAGPGTQIDPVIYYKQRINMAELEDLASARILAEGILGRDRGQTHAGAYDADLNAYHVGQPLSNSRIMGLWQSGEAAAAVNLREAQANFYNSYKDRINDLLDNPTNEQYAEIVWALDQERLKVEEAEKRLKEEQASKTEDTQLLDEGKGLFAWVKKLIERIKK